MSLGKNLSYYHQEILKAMPEAELVNKLTGQFNIPRHAVEFKISGFVEHRAAFRVLDLEWLQQSGLDFEQAAMEAERIRQSLPEPESQCITMPTRGMTVEPVLGECCACDDFIKQHRDKDLLLKDAEVLSAQLENQRLEKRLAAGLLGDPTPFESGNRTIVDARDDG